MRERPRSFSLAARKLPLQECVIFRIRPLLATVKSLPSRANLRIIRAQLKWAMPCHETVSLFLAKEALL